MKPTNYLSQKSHKSYWVVKARELLADGRSGWHWKKYLASKGSAIVRDWGGPGWIESRTSRKFIRNEFKAGDIVVCYQFDDKAILGFTRLASRGTDNGSFDLEPPVSAYRLPQSLTIAYLRSTGCNPEAFTSKKGLGTVAKLNSEDLNGIVAAVIAHSPDEEAKFLAGLKASGFSDGSRPSIRRLPNAKLSGENAAPLASEIESKIAKIEKDLARRDDVYVAREITAMIRRDGQLIQALKAKYRNRCQFPLCEAHIPKRVGGAYCEVAHIQAIATGGEAKRINLVVVCPNHHKMIDYGDMKIVKNTALAITISLNGHTVKINH